MAALNGHFGTVQLLMDLGASVSDVTVEDGTTIDLIGDSDVTLFFCRLCLFCSLYLGIVD